MSGLYVPLKWLLQSQNIHTPFPGSVPIIDRQQFLTFRITEEDYLSSLMEPHQVHTLSTLGHSHGILWLSLHQVYIPGTVKVGDEAEKDG